MWPTRRSKTGRRKIWSTKIRRMRMTGMRRRKGRGVNEGEREEGEEKNIQKLPPSLYQYHNHCHL